MSKLAVIDLGTNTFHLLIVEAQKGKPFREIFRKSTYVKLAEDGIHTIGEVPFKRGLDTLIAYQALLANHTPDDLKIFGTAALRTASNGQAFVEEVKARTGFDVHLIPGSEEARLIHKGVAQAVPFGEAKNLIIDIGGGSVEFIIADQDQVYWAQSFPIGIAILYRDWQAEDPISRESIGHLIHFFSQQLHPLLQALEKHPTPSIIGASGAFDVLQDFLCPGHQQPIYSAIPSSKFHPFYQDILNKSLPERYEMEDLPKDKAEMIVVALILIDFILQQTQADTIFVSAYAMKEGMLSEMINF